MIQEEKYNELEEFIRGVFSDPRIQNKDDYCVEGKRLEYASGRYIYVAEVLAEYDIEEISIDITDELFEAANKYNEGPKTDNDDVWREIILHTNPGNCWVKRVEKDGVRSFELSKETPEIRGILTNIINAKTQYDRNGQTF